MKRVDSAGIRAVVFWAHFAGLANRLRALVGYQAMAAVLGVPFHLCWEPNDLCDCGFEHLFDGHEIDLITPRQKARLGVVPGTQTFDAVPYYSEIWRTHLAECCFWEDFRLQAVGFLRQLQPVAPVRTAVEEFAARHGLESRYGLHIRMTDNIEAYSWFAKHSSDFAMEKVSRLKGFEKFIRSTLEREPDAAFFLATDNQEAEARVLCEAGGHMITYPKAFRTSRKKVLSLRRLTWETRTQSTSRIRAALTEMLLLSRCSKIVGTYYSSFSEVAAIWGGRPHFVVLDDRVEETPGIAELMGKEARAGG